MVFFQLNVTGLLFQSFRTASPYSILAGNPARFIRFRFSLEDQLKQDRLRLA